MQLIDVRHLGRERVIGCWLVGDVLIDPGPEASLETLLDELSEPPRALLLTHIHLDHAGATGALVKRWPELDVYVHERGARHLADPTKLIASASRLYGDAMERLWGEIVPVPNERIHPLRGGEEVLGFRVAYTPGHASHHVSYFHNESGRAFVGDVAGVRIPPSDLVLAPTPPPDIDLELWQSSLESIRDWDPADLGITHFGAIGDPEAHLEAVAELLERWGKMARKLDRDKFVSRLRSEIEEGADPDAAAGFIQAMPPEQQWLGLERYWNTK